MKSVKIGLYFLLISSCLKFPSRHVAGGYFPQQSTLLGEISPSKRPPTRARRRIEIKKETKKKIKEGKPPCLGPEASGTLVILNDDKTSATIPGTGFDYDSLVFPYAK